MLKAGFLAFKTLQQMWPSIAGTLAHTVATALHLSQAHEVEQLGGTHRGAGLQTRALLSCCACSRFSGGLPVG